MSVTPDEPGTVPAQPEAGGGGEPEPTPTTEGGDKYEALLQRLTGMEQRVSAAEQERDTLLARINNGLEPQRSTTAQPDEISRRVSRFEQTLHYNLENGNEAEKDLAATMLGFFNFVRQMPGQFSEQVALAPLDVATRQQVQAEMKAAADQGVRMTPEYAREIINLRAQSAELTKLKAQPPPQPPNTRVVPSPVPAPTPQGSEGFGGAWNTATPEQRDQMMKDWREGKYHLKPA